MTLARQEEHPVPVPDWLYSCLPTVVKARSYILVQSGYFIMAPEFKDMWMIVIEQGGSSWNSFRCRGDTIDSMINREKFFVAD
jgi:hypothetical protein